MGATTAPNAEFWDGGKPVAYPFYLVDVNGNTLSFSTVAGNVNLNQVNGATVSLGQATAAASIPVVLASNSSPVSTNTDTAALITAAAVTTGQTGSDQTNTVYRGVIAVLDMTAVGTGSVTLNIQGKDAASGKYYTLATGTAQITNVTTYVALYPGASSTAPSGSTNVAGVLPKVWRVTTTANNANATTYTVGASLIL